MSKKLCSAQQINQLETTDGVAETLPIHPAGSKVRSVQFHAACVFRIIATKDSRRLVFLSGHEPSPETAACLQEAFHRHPPGSHMGGRLETPDFAGDAKQAERYLNHLFGLAKDFFATEHPLSCQPFGKYAFQFEALTSAQLDELAAIALSKLELPAGWFQELESTSALRQALASLISLHRLADQADSPIETLLAAQAMLQLHRAACGQLIESLFNRWSGKQWDDFETSRTVASLMDAAAASLRLRFQVVDKSGQARLATLRSARTGRDRKPSFQYEFSSGGHQSISRASRRLLPAKLVPAPADVRRRRRV